MFLFSIVLPNRPGGLDNGLVVWPIPLLTNVTSVTYLRINIQYDRDDDNEFTFLSEIRIAERLQGIRNYQNNIMVIIIHESL